MEYYTKQGKETDIEAILNPDESREFTPYDTLNKLEIYLNNGAEELTLDQYKKVRQLVDQNYRSLVAKGLESGYLSQNQVNRVGKIFTDYIRDQHARLLDEQNEQKNRQKIIKAEEQEPKKSWFSKGKDYIKNIVKTNNREYQNDWRKKDSESFYKLERLLYKDNENPAKEKELIESLPTQDVSRYKIQTLERLLPKTHYKASLSNIINSCKWNYTRQRAA